MLNRFRLAAPQDGAATLSGDEQAMEIVMAVAGEAAILVAGCADRRHEPRGETDQVRRRPLWAHRTGMLRNPKSLLLD
jgi:hypothetical protein